MICLMFERHTAFPNKETMFFVLQQHLGKISHLSCNEEFAEVVADEYVADSGDGDKMPVIIRLTRCRDAMEYQPDEFTKSQMRWSCPGYKEILRKCQYHMAAFDVSGGNLRDYKKRARLIVRMTEALIEMFPACRAVVFEPSGKMHMREDILNCRMPEEHKFIEYAVNVRLSNIQGSEDMLIDSVGMSVLHLPDIQYYFHGIDSECVAYHAYSLLSYIYDNNPVFRSGDTIDGLKDGEISASELWGVNYGEPLIRPERLVLDINMGRYASGYKNSV